MSDLKLIYFDMHGGRGEPIRLALAMAGVPFEDERFGFEQWPERKESMPFGAVPVLEVDGKPLAQSNAITRYVGKLTGLYPADYWQAALCDEAMDAAEDLTNLVGATLFMPEDEKKARREELVAGAIPFYLSGLEKRLKANGGRYFADDRLTIADLKVAVLVRLFMSGLFDHIPTDITKTVAPALTEHHDRVVNDPAIKGYYAKHGVEV